MVAGMVTVMTAHEFSESERHGVYRAIHERRDVRSHFLPAPIPQAVLGRILNAAHHAPSVGFMQPWDFVLVEDPELRRAVHGNFDRANRKAGQVYEGEQRVRYERLKLAGVLDAPVNLCVTCDPSRSLGAGLGRQSDANTALYSAVCAVQNLWLAARAESLGVGWVSILDFEELRALLGIPQGHAIVAYLCIGYVSEFRPRPDLEENRWENRLSLDRVLHFDHWEHRDAARSEALLVGATFAEGGTAQP